MNDYGSALPRPVRLICARPVPVSAVSTRLWRGCFWIRVHVGVPRWSILYKARRHVRACLVVGICAWRRVGTHGFLSISLGFMNGKSSTGEIRG
jgi:hypothetical protein